MLETLLGGVFGGLLRLAPEALKLWDRGNERKHELQMLQQEHEFAKTRAELEMHTSDNLLQAHELDAIRSAFQEQAQTAQAGGKFVSAISALVRPTVTYIFILVYALVKVASYLLALAQGGAWSAVLVGLWGTDDAAILNMILSFWFVGRVYERQQSK